MREIALVAIVGFDKYRMRRGSFIYIHPHIYVQLCCTNGRDPIRKVCVTARSQRAVFLVLFVHTCGSVVDIVSV